MDIDPVRSSPERIKALTRYFGTPGAFLRAITDGNGQIRASKELARKIRDRRRKEVWIG